MTLQPQEIYKNDFNSKNFQIKTRKIDAFVQAGVEIVLENYIKCLIIANGPRNRKRPRN